MTKQASNLEIYVDDEPDGPFSEDARYLIEHFGSEELKSQPQSIIYKAYEHSLAYLMQTDCAD